MTQAISESKRKAFHLEESEVVQAGQGGAMGLGAPGKGAVDPCPLETTPERESKDASTNKPRSFREAFGDGGSGLAKGPTKGSSSRERASATKPTQNKRSRRARESSDLARAIEISALAA